jgi:hypothetical protein
LLELEDGLLDTAKDDFEFLSNHEHEDLSRLKKDRNLCAHPAFTGTEVLFQEALAVLVIQKDRLAPITTGDHVVDGAGEFQS